MDNVQLVGFSELDAHERADAERHVAEFVARLQKSYPIEHLTVHLKQYDKGGKPKFSVHVRFLSPGHTKDAAADDFVLSKAIHYAFEAVLKQLGHQR